MKGIVFPDDFRLKPLGSDDRRQEFDCGEAQVNDWLSTKALQSQAKHLDCINDGAKSFYQQWDFAELPGNPYRLVLSAKSLDAMMQKPK